MPAQLRARSAILDGEIVCLNESGKTQFEDLLFRRGDPRFCAFDLLWCDGEDLRYLPLIERKWRLRSVVKSEGCRLLYCDHLENDGEGLFRLACENDLEGIVAKQQYAPYLPGQETRWFKIRNQSYSQWAGREELFERERGGDPDVRIWDSCVVACAETDEIGSVASRLNYFGTFWQCPQSVIEERPLWSMQPDSSGHYFLHLVSRLRRGWTRL